MFAINERFLIILDKLNISAYKMAKELGSSEAVLSNIKNGKNKPSIEIIEKILNNYKVINPRWLLIGEGEMFNDPTDQTTNTFQAKEETSQPEKDHKMIDHLLKEVEDLKSQRDEYKMENKELKVESKRLNEEISKLRKQLDDIWVSNKSEIVEIKQTVQK
jgi:transcriptional regulator with XRE-family HTH domain